MKDANPSRERPILFSAPMVRAILDGRKTQTRRVVKFPHANPLGQWEVGPFGGPNGGRTRDGETIPFQNVIAHSRTGDIVCCPYGQPGDRLWVRETWADVRTPASKIQTIYRADWPHKNPSIKPWTPSIHMPRWASRITLEITGIRVERLNDISEADARAEGVELADGFRELWKGYAKNHHDLMPTAAESFASLWCSINGDGSWAANPWVWVVEFRRVEA